MLFYFIDMFLFVSYENVVDDRQDVAKKLVAGENPPMCRVYKPEFVTLSPPLMNCQDEVRKFCIYTFLHKDIFMRDVYTDCIEMKQKHLYRCFFYINVSICKRLRLKSKATIA